MRLRRRLAGLLTALLLVLANHEALAVEEECQVLSKIDLQISGWVTTKALLRQFTQKEGDCFDRVKFFEELQDLRDRGSFKKLDANIIQNPNGTVTLSFDVEYGWPFVPSFSYQGGAFQQFGIGGFMPSFLGNLHELGAKYNWRDGKHFFNFWFTAPNFFAQNSTFNFELVMTGNIINKYGFDSLPVPLSLQKKYDASHYRYVIPTESYEVLLRGGLFDVSYDVLPRMIQLSFRYLLLFETVNKINNYSDYIEHDLLDLDGPPLDVEPIHTVPLSMGVLAVKIGKPALMQQYRLVGHQLMAFLAGSHEGWGSGRSFLTAAAIYRGFIPMGRYFDLVLRLGLAHTSSDDFIDYLNIGSENFENLVVGNREPGLTNVRGFRSNQFRGQNIAYGNIEVRARLIHNVRLIFKSFGNFTLQAAAFVDAGHVWNDNQFFDNFGDTMALSVGGGLVTTLQAFRDTYVNYYIAQTLLPYRETSFNIVMTKSFY